MDTLFLPDTAATTIYNQVPSCMTAGARDDACWMLAEVNSKKKRLKKNISTTRSLGFQMIYCDRALAVYVFLLHRDQLYSSAECMGLVHDRQHQPHGTAHLVHALEFRRFYCIANHRSRTTQVNNKNKVSLGRACKMQIHLTKKGKNQFWKKHHCVLVPANVSFLVGYFLVHVQCSRPLNGVKWVNTVASGKPWWHPFELSVVASQQFKQAFSSGSERVETTAQT